MYNFGIEVLNVGGGKMGLKHRAKEAYLETEARELAQQQIRINKLFDKYYKQALKERKRYVRIARMRIRGVDEDHTVNFSFMDRRPNDKHPIIQLWDEDEDRIILNCTLVKVGRFSFYKLHALVDCKNCNYTHRVVGREIMSLKDIYLAMNDPAPIDCEYLGNNNPPSPR